MKKKTKLFVSIGFAALGIGFSCISYGFQESMWKGIVFGLGISILTTAIMDIYEYISNYSKKEVIMECAGILDIANNKTSNSQKFIYTNAKTIRVIFNTGVDTFRKYRDTIIKLIIEKNCNVQVVLSSANVLQSGMYTSAENETEITKKLIQDIIESIKDRHYKGSIELRYSNIAPIASVEIKDNKFCTIVPYMYKRNSANSYHATYKNTGKDDDMYHKWEKHFEEIWKNGDTILKYPI